MGNGFSINSLAEHWGVSTKTVRRLIKKGMLGYLPVGNRIVIRELDLQNYEQRHGQPAGRAKAFAERILKERRDGDKVPGC